MEPTLSSGAGSGNSGTYTPEIAESLRFEEEIQSLMRLEPPAAGGGSSFTALLGLPANQAVELLHDPESGDSPAASSGPVAGAGAGAGDGWLFRLRDPRAPQFPLPCSPPTFPTNAALVERAARFSVFAAEDSPEAAFSDGPSASGDQRRSPKPKVEPPDSDACPPISGEGPQQRPAKRKEAERSKAKASTKKSKAVEESAAAAEKEKLPYVHVRARRGQATDSHSLAERARREKINARMKLLQELVPGCSKISGTALVLDEIINHVQALQRQVEFLSMRLAAVNPRIDFSALDSFLSVECGRVTAGNVTMEPAAWHRPPEQQQEQQQIWHVDLMHPEQAGASPPLSMWERNDASRVFANPGSSVFGYDPASRPNPVTLHSSQLKTEL